MSLSLWVTVLAAFGVLGFLNTAQADENVVELDLVGSVGALAQAGDPVVQVDAGERHACALYQSGKVYCWGNGAFGQLGTDLLFSSLPVMVEDLDDIVQISMGAYHSCALQNGGRVFCWGANTSGELGDGSLEHSHYRVRVKAGPKAVQVTAGHKHTCLIMSNGRAFCWGSNFAGRLGHGNTDQVFFPTPQRVAGGRRFVDISAGFLTTCGVTRNGRAYCWGRSSAGSLGNGDFAGNVYSPDLVRFLKRVEQVSVGGYHSCALRDDGVAYCWGTNQLNQLGDGTDDEYQIDPTRVKRLFDVTDIDAGFRHTCALRENGSAMCWGDNRYGQIGDGTTTQRATRERVKRLKNVTSLSAGDRFTCASRADGNVFCWGANNHSQLGKGDSNLVANPIRTRVELPASP